MNIKQVFGTSLLAWISIGLFVGFKRKIKLKDGNMPNTK
jgi:hypothetical protein